MRARMLCESTDMAYSSWEITSEEPLLVKASTARSFSTWNRLGQKRRGMFSIGTEGAIVMSAGTAPSRPVASCFQWRFEASAPTAVLHGSPDEAGNQGSSEPIKGHQSPSKVIRGHQRVYSGSPIVMPRSPGGG